MAVGTDTQISGLETLGCLVCSPEDDLVLEGEVAVDALQLADLEDGQPDVQDTVLVLRVLHDQEEAWRGEL